ncbi:ABC transporter substrate-binding protein [Streptococcus castoreus]|uniref:ABC transporter substrate-binding protein n=1 Tax=Streptococcus castoreus TaxID=254786 RepID=UPI0004253328|nr:ABC transporter substrate-binding protein [Streptococcus castoreus]
MGFKKIVLVAFMSFVTLSLVACRQQMNRGHESAKIGIIQYAEHSALDAAREGFIEALSEGGFKVGKNVTITKRNAQGDQANLQTMVEQLSGKNDLNFAIATPAAQALLNSDQHTPAVFTAVTDPVSAGLVDSLDKPGGNMTGSTDAIDVKDQIDLLTKVLPQAKTVGIFYNSSEVNSEIQAKAAKKALEKKGVTVLIKTVTVSNDVQQVMTSLAGQVDAVYLPTDNTVASTANTIGDILKEAKIPSMGSDDAYLSAVLFTSGVDYKAIGKQAGKQAVAILKGKKAATIKVVKPQKAKIAVNEEMAKSLGIDAERIKDFRK